MPVDRMLRKLKRGMIVYHSSFLAFSSNRGDGIRTHDLLVPNQALYQAEPRPGELYTFAGKKNTFTIIPC